jgi:hypothetical protein
MTRAEWTRLGGFSAAVVLLTSWISDSYLPHNP